MKFNYQKVKDLAKEGTEKLKKEIEINSFDKKMTIIYSYATDLVDASKIIKNELDFTMEKNKSLGDSIMITYMSNKKKGYTKEQNQQDLIKKIGSYELITHYNFFLQNNDFEVELIEQNKTDDIMDIVLTLENTTIDIFKIVTDCVKNDFIYNSNINLLNGFNPNGMEIAINMERLYNKVAIAIKRINKN